MMKINKRLAQQIVDTLKDVCGYDINFIDHTGVIFASTNAKRIGGFHEIGQAAAKSGETIEVAKDNSFRGTQKGVNIPVFHHNTLMAVIGISGEPKEVRQYAYLAVRITKLLIREQEMEVLNRSQKEKMNYIVRSLVKGEVINREYLSECLNDMQLDEKDEMKVVLIWINQRSNTSNASLVEQKLLGLFDFIQVSLYTYEYPNVYIAILSNKKGNTALKSLQEFAESNRDILKVSVGSTQTLYYLSHSYEAAEIALESLKGKSECFLEFDWLDIEIILGSLNPIIREKYLHKTTAGLNSDDRNLLKIYFEENMSLKNTCDILFLHKNTLQYKLDRIGRITGYNPRKFKEAVVLYIAMKL